MPENTTYKHILKDGSKVQVDSAIRDGEGYNINSWYVKKDELMKLNYGEATYNASSSTWTVTINNPKFIAEPGAMVAVKFDSVAKAAVQSLDVKITSSASAAIGKGTIGYAAETGSRVQETTAWSAGAVRTLIYAKDVSNNAYWVLSTGKDHTVNKSETLGAMTPLIMDNPNDASGIYKQKTTGVAQIVGIDGTNGNLVFDSPETGEGSAYLKRNNDTPQTNVTITLPAQTGVLALEDDIPETYLKTINKSSHTVTITDQSNTATTFMENDFTATDVSITERD